MHPTYLVARTASVYADNVAFVSVAVERTANRELPPVGVRQRNGFSFTVGSGQIAEPLADFRAEIRTRSGPGASHCFPRRPAPGFPGPNGQGAAGSPHRYPRHRAAPAEPARPRARRRPDRSPVPPFPSGHGVECGGSPGGEASAARRYPPPSPTRRGAVPKGPPDHGAEGALGARKSTARQPLRPHQTIAPRGAPAPRSRTVHRNLGGSRA